MSLRVSLVRMPLASPFSNSKSTAIVRSALILQLVRGGVEAFSECVTDASLSSTGEDNETALGAIRRVFATEISSAILPTPGEFLEATRGETGCQMAKAAVEMLLWDYQAKTRDQPLDQVLGESRGYAEAGISLGLEGILDIRTRIEAALERGYRRIKVKIERHGALERLRAIRDSFPTIPLSADANGCFEIEKDVPTLRRMDTFDLEYIEQPLAGNDLAGHANLAREIATPICLDESVTSLEEAEKALELRAAKVINIKPGRVGGLAPALEIARAARRRGAHVWVGGMLETGVGRASNIALAAQELIDYPGDTSPNDRYFEKDMVTNPFVMEDGLVRPNPGPGIGINLDRDFLHKHTLRIWDLF